MLTRVEVGDLCCDHCDSNRVCCDHCNPKWVCCDFARPKKNYATLREPNKACCDFARPKTDMLRLFATQNGYVVTLCDPKQICCDFSRLKLGMLQPLRLKMSMLRLCATETFAVLCATQNRYVATSRVEF